MEKTIKYLENGEYHYATVKDVGDLAKLKTDSKDDLVTAINELFITGGEGPKKPDGYDGLVDNVADAIKKQQEMTDTITNMQQNAQLSDADMQHMKQVQEELHQEYLKALKELNEAVDKAKADAADLDKKTSDLQDKLDETFANVEKEVSDVHKQLDSESAGLRKDLDDTKTSLESTRKDLLNNTQEFGVVNSEVKELKDKMDRRIWSTDLDPVREQVNKNTTEVSQTKDELKNKADQSSLDLVTNSVENLSTQVKENADGLKVSVKKDELGGDVARLLNDKTNLLLGTRSFSGEDNWRNRDKVTIEPGYYKGMKTAAVQVTDASIYQPYRVKANTAYTFSFFGKEDRDNPKATLVIKPIDAQNVNVDGGEQQVHITTEWQRFAVTFSLDQECEISIQIIQGPEATNNILHLAGLKLQYGQNDTPWEPNEADVAENIEHTESQFNVYSDQIAGIVKKQEKMGDTERQLDTRITETAEGLKQTSKDLQDANGKITEFKGQLESTARGLKTEYEKYTNDAIGQISDSSLNLIHNSSFSNGEDELASWQNVSAKVTVKEDNNGLHWIELTQTGQSTDNPIGITSNYFIVKQGKVTVAVDIKLGDKANIDNQNILLLELYNDAKQRVDFTDVSLEQLGLSMDIVGDHNVHRGLYRLGIDRKDVKYMTVKAILHRNGDLWLTNFSARLSSIDDGGYTPNPDDVNQQILKQNTKIEQNAKEVALKANSVDVTRDIKSAVQNSNGGGVNLLPNSKDLHTGWTADGTSIYPVDDYLGVRATGGNQRLFIDPTEDTKGKLLSVSFDAYIPGDSKDQSVQVLVGPFGSAMDVVVSGNDFKHYKAENWKWNSDYSALSIQLKNVNDKINIKNIKLEYGPVATPWTPNPQDVSEEIKSAKDAAIKVASDQIDIHVNELSTSFDDKLNKRVNEVKTASEKFTSDGIEQVVTKVTNVKNDVDRLDQRVATNNGGGINLLRGTGSEWKTLTGSVWFCQTTGAGAVELGSFTTGDTVTYSITVRNNSQYAVRPEIVGFSDDNGTRSFNISGTESVQPGETKTVSVSATVAENTVKIIGWLISSGAEPTFSVDAKNEKLERGSVATPWSPNPQDAKTYTDSQIVNTNKKIDTQTLDSANIDQMKTQGHYFVHNLTGNPIGGWVYVDVTGNNNDRIRQDVYQDTGGKHMYRRLFGNSWSGWEQGAYLSDVNNVKTEVTASVKNLGDRVTTEVNSITSRVNSNNGGGINLLQGTAKCEFPLHFNGGTQTVQKYDDETNYIQHTSNTPINRMGLWWSLTPEVGQVYTLSADVCGNGYIQGGEFHYEGGEAGSLNRVDLTNDWQRISNTFRVNTIDGWQNWVIYADNSTLLKVKHIKIERGSVATPWSPSPEDANEAIKQVNTKLDVANGQIQGKVTETQVQDLLNRGHYATQEWSQGQINLTKDQFNVDIKKVTNDLNSRVNEVKTASEKFTSDGIEQTVKKITDVKNDVSGLGSRIDNLQVGGRNLALNTEQDIVIDDTSNTGTQGWKFATINLTQQPKVGDQITVSAEGTLAGKGNLGTYDVILYNSTTSHTRSNSKRLSSGKRASATLQVNNLDGNGDTVLLIYAGNISDTEGKENTVHHLKVEFGNVATDWTPAPEDINQKIDTQTLDSANIDEMKTQGHYFVHNLTGNPIGGWVYVDVMGVDGRIRQDVYQDNGTKHMYRRLFGDSWSGWEQGAYLSDVSSAKTEVTASVKNLGDRVTTEVNSITTRQNNLENESRSQHSNDIELVRKSDFEDGEKGTWSTQSVVAASSPAPPAELGQSGMKVLQTNTRDAYEEGIWYSVKPGEKFNIDFWCAPSSAFPSQFGLAFVDKDKRNYNWQGVPTKQSGPWEHCTGIIEAPANAAFAKPWFQMDKPGDNTGNTAWLAKPHIRRQDPRVADTIKEINTQLDVANGQIQGKVTATDVNNILNGKGYATQSWAQSQFRMKSDSIDLEVQKITNPIQNKLASVSDEFNKRIKDNLLYGTASFIGNWRNWSNDKSWIQSKDKVDPYGNTVMMRKGSWEGYYQPLWLEKGVYTFTCWYWLGDDTPDNTNLYFYARPNGGSYPVEINVTRGASLNTTKNSWQKAIATFNVTKAGNSAVRIECDRDITLCIGSYKLEKGPNESMWCEQPQESSATDIISKINITPDNIKLASNKIVLDGDTQITGKAFIPSAAIQNINAEKITTGTLDVGKLNIKNLKADDIKTGTLSGITIRAGEEDGFFQTSEDNIYWITNSGGSAVIGKGKYVQYPGLNVFDNNAVYLGSWAGAELNKDGTINDYGGALGNPKLAIETGGMRRRFNVDSWGGEFEDKPLDNNRIISWVGNKEFLSVERKNGTHIELNPDINDSQFTVQKDDKFGAYFGQGRDGNEINFTPIGGMTINGNFRVTGAKNAIVKTSQGTVAINAYETAGYFFGDIGSAKTSDNKVAMIDIESLFKETVNTDVEYQVFLTSYGPGDIWVSERQRDYFVVESELPNMEFGWEIKAKRKGYENTRLAKVDVSNVPTV